MRTYQRSPAEAIFQQTGWRGRFHATHSARDLKRILDEWPNRHGRGSRTDNEILAVSIRLRNLTRET